MESASNGQQQPASEGGLANEGTPGQSEGSGSFDGDMASAAAQVEKEIRKYKVKVDGKESEVDEAELLRGYQHAKAAHNRMREAAEARKLAESYQKNVQNFFAQLKQNPRMLFDVGPQLGVNFEDVAHQFVLEKLKYETMPEEERKRFDMEKELERYRESERKNKLQEAQRQLQAHKQQVSASVEQEIVQYFGSLGEQQSPEIAARTVEHLLNAHTARQPISVQRAHELARRDIQAIEKRVFEQSLQMLIGSGNIPENLRKAVREADLKAMRQQAVGTAPTERRQSAPQKPKTVDEWFNAKEKK